MNVINFFGAPGVGKTTKTLELTPCLKKLGIDAEPSFEVVKEHIYAGNENMLSYQNFIFAQQEKQLRILLNSNETEFAITDSPLLLCVVYAPENYPVFFKDLVFEIFNSYNNINYFIHRKHEYSHQGRVHNQKESENLSKKIYNFLINHNVEFTEIDSTTDISYIVEDITNNHRVENYKRKER